MALLTSLERALDRVLGWGMWLVLPVSLLLFLQWPLRDVVRAYSREANDLAQWLFALYIALAVTETTRKGGHIAADALAQHYSAATRRRLIRISALGFVAPWAFYLLYTGTVPAWLALRQLEAFPDSYNPGYFIIKVAGWLLAALVLVQALIDGIRPEPRQDGENHR